MLSHNVTYNTTANYIAHTRAWFTTSATQPRGYQEVKSGSTSGDYIYRPLLTFNKSAFCTQISICIGHMILVKSRDYFPRQH